MLDIRFDATAQPVSVAPSLLRTLRIKLLARASRDSVHVQVGAPKPTEFLVGMEPRLTLNGVSVPGVVVENGVRFGDPTPNLLHHEITWVVVVPTEILRAIENSRTDDVRVDFSCQMNFWTNAPEFGSPFFSAYPNFQSKLSQTDWNKLLIEIGYQGAWILEIPRPVAPGLEKSMEFLRAAQDRIQAHDPVGAITDCRKAWDSADAPLDAMASERDNAIDGLSIGEPGKPSKSKRIADTRLAIDRFCQIGPHSDRYVVTADDALAAFRLTASMIAYLAKKAQDAQRGRPA